MIRELDPITGKPSELKLGGFQQFDMLIVQELYEYNSQQPLFHTLHALKVTSLAIRWHQFHK